MPEFCFGRSLADMQVRRVFWHVICFIKTYMFRQNLFSNRITRTDYEC